MTARNQNIAITRMAPLIAYAREGGEVKEESEMDASLMVIATASIL